MVFSMCIGENNVRLILGHLKQFITSMPSASELEMLPVAPRYSPVSIYPLLEPRDPHMTYGTLSEDYERDLEYVKGNGLNLRYISHPAEELCLIAVAQTGLALEFIQNPSEHVCQAAIQQNPRAARFLPNHTGRNQSL